MIKVQIAKIIITIMICSENDSKTHVQMDFQNETYHLRTKCLKGVVVWQQRPFGPDLPSSFGDKYQFDRNEWRSGFRMARCIEKRTNLI